VQAAEVEALHHGRLLYVDPARGGLRLHGHLPADPPAAVVRRVHQGLVAHQDAAVPLCRRRGAPPQGDVRVRQRRDALVPHSRRAQLQVQALHALAERLARGQHRRARPTTTTTTPPPAQDDQRLTERAPPRPRSNRRRLNSRRVATVGGAKST